MAMVIKYKDRNHPFMNETKFRAWATDLMRGQGWHTQPLNDYQDNGIPDVSAAHKQTGECWLELKLGAGIRSVNNPMRCRYPPTSQQLLWLKQRAETVIFSHAGLLIGYSTGSPEETIDYVSWVRIDQWEKWKAWPVMNWALSPQTAMLEWLQRGECKMYDLILGNLTPGYLHQSS